MDAIVERSYSKLLNNLEDMTTLYRQLLDVVRKEKEMLLSAQLDELTENNLIKDQILMKIRLVDTLRYKHAQELALVIKADFENPRLLDLAQKISSLEGDKLRSLHATLDLLIRRLMEFNRENEAYAQKALQTLNGSMNDIKETLTGKKTYEKKGHYKAGPEQAGNFVSKEV